MISKRRS